MISSQVINDFLTRPPKDRFVAIVDHDNDSVLHLLGNKTGWKSFKAGKDLSDALGATKDWESGNPYVWLGASSDTLSHQARLVLELIEQGQLTNKKTGETLALDLKDFPLANDLRPYVEELATGKFGEELSKKRHTSLRTVRERLETHMKGALQSPHIKP